MLIQKSEKKELLAFLETLHLVPERNNTSNRSVKGAQILAYFEIMHAQLRKYSSKRELMMLEFGAGNCYLSFLIYYFYHVMRKRSICICCVDWNTDLMAKCERRAEELGFHGLSFHGSDIQDFCPERKVDVVYTLHACDTATDKALYQAVKLGASCIFSVSCCQHSIKKQMRTPSIKGVTRHRIFRDRMLYMAADSMRSLLLEERGYTVDILEFVSSRYTDKNVMIRGIRGNAVHAGYAAQEYRMMKENFRITPKLEEYFAKG